MLVFKIIVVLLKIIGILLLILLAAMCVPVHLGVLYEESVAVRIRYLFMKYTFDGGEQSGETKPSDQTEKPQNKLQTALLMVAGFFVWLFEAVKNGILTLIRYIKRGIAALKKKFRKNLKPKKKKSTSDTENPKKKQKQSLFGTLREERSFWGAVQFFVELGKALGGAMVRIYRGVAIDKFTIRAAVAGEDAADTAIKYGEVCSVAFPALSFLLVNARRYTQDIQINPDFGGDGMPITFDGEFVIYPILVLAHLLGAVMKFILLQIKITLQNKKNQEEKEKG